MTPGATRAHSQSERAKALLVISLLKACFQSLSYCNVKGSVMSSSNYIMSLAPKSRGMGPSHISTCEFSAKDPMLILMELMSS